MWPFYSLNSVGYMIEQYILLLMSISVWKYRLSVKSEDLRVCGAWRQHVIHFRCDHEAQQNHVQSNILGIAVRSQRINILQIKRVRSCRSQIGVYTSKYTVWTV